MAVLDDFLARIGGMGMTPPNASPYTSPQSFGSAFGTTPVNIGGMSGLPGGTAPIARTTGISPMRGIGFGSMPPSVPPTPTRGFGSRLGDAFKDPSKFADLATGAALISGTPIAEAFAIREALAPTTSTSKSVGSVYNVRNRTTGELTGKQVYSTDRAEMEKIAADPNLELVTPTEASEVGSIRPDYALITGEDGQQYEQIIKNSETYRGARREIRELNNSSATLKGQISQDISDIDFIITEGQDLGLLDLVTSNIPFTDNKAIKDRIARFQTRNFMDTIEAMRKASKTGGAVGQVTEKEMLALGNAKRRLDFGDKYLIQELLNQRSELIAGFGKVMYDVSSYIDDVNSELGEGNMVEKRLPDSNFPEPPAVGSSVPKKNENDDEDIRSGLY
jgi:hypothetical protein